MTRWHARCAPRARARALTPTLVLTLVLVAVARARGASAAAAHLPLELRPPRASGGDGARGFPARPLVFEFVEPSPLSAGERARWSLLERAGVDARWREDRLRPGALRTTERYHAVDLLGGITKVGEYYTTIRIGGQKVRVQVDTGSSTLALPVAECVDCPISDLRYNMKRSTNKAAHVVSCGNSLCAPDKCVAHGCQRCSATDACCSTENPSGCGFSLKYGDGSFARGALMIDTLSWGSNLSAPVVFGGILADSPQFERPLVDGIMGLAYQALACNPTCVEPPFQQMVKSGVVKDSFGICMTPRGGKLILGDIDPALAKGSISYVPMALSKVPTYYTVNISSTVRIGNGSIPLPNFRYGVIDSGTTLIGCTKVTFVSILRYMQKHYCHIPHMCGASTWFLPSACVHISPDVVAQLPTFTFLLGAGTGSEFSLELRPEDYLVQSVNNGVTLRCVGFMALDHLSPGTDIIFGNTIMLRYLTVYDRANKRMGFAESSGTCGAPPDCSSYAQCVECATEPECAFNFKTKKCMHASGVRASVLSFPVCKGSGCRCGIGQSFLFYGFATGFLISMIAIAASVAVLYACGALRASGKESRAYELADEEGEPAAESEPMPLVDNEK